MADSPDVMQPAKANMEIVNNDETTVDFTSKATRLSKTPSKERVSLGAPSAYYFKYLNSSSKRKLDSSMMGEDQTGEISIPGVALDKSTTETSFISIGDSSSGSEGTDPLNKSTLSDTTELTASNFVLAATSRQKFRIEPIAVPKQAVGPVEETRATEDERGDSRTKESSETGEVLMFAGQSSVSTPSKDIHAHNTQRATGESTGPSREKLEEPEVKVSQQQGESIREPSPSLRSRISASPRSLRNFAASLKKTRIERQIQREEDAKRRLSNGNDTGTFSVSTAFDMADSKPVSRTRLPPPMAQNSPYSEHFMKEFMSSPSIDRLSLDTSKASTTDASTQELLGVMDQLFEGLHRHSSSGNGRITKDKPFLAATNKGVGPVAANESPAVQAWGDSSEISSPVLKEKSPHLFENNAEDSERRRVPSDVQFLEKSAGGKTGSSDGEGESVDLAATAAIASPSSTANAALKLTPGSIRKPTPTGLSSTPRRILNPRLMDSPARNTRSAKKKQMMGNIEDTGDISVNPGISLLNSSSKISAGSSPGSEPSLSQPEPATLFNSPQNEEGISPTVSSSKILMRSYSPKNESKLTSPDKQRTNRQISVASIGSIDDISVNPGTLLLNLSCEKAQGSSSSQPSLSQPEAAALFNSPLKEKGKSEHTLTRTDYPRVSEFASPDAEQTNTEISQTSIGSVEKTQSDADRTGNDTYGDTASIGDLADILGMNRKVQSNTPGWEGKLSQASSPPSSPLEEVSSPQRNKELSQISFGSAERTMDETNGDTASIGDIADILAMVGSTEGTTTKDDDTSVAPSLQSPSTKTKSTQEAPSPPEPPLETHSPSEAEISMVREDRRNSDLVLGSGGQAKTSATPPSPHLKKETEMNKNATADTTDYIGDTTETLGANKSARTGASSKEEKVLWSASSSTSGSSQCKGIEIERSDDLRSQSLSVSSMLVSKTTKISPGSKNNKMMGGSGIRMDEGDLHEKALLALPSSHSIEHAVSKASIGPKEPASPSPESSQPSRHPLGLIPPISMASGEKSNPENESNVGMGDTVSLGDLSGILHSDSGSETVTELLVLPKEQKPRHLRLQMSDAAVREADLNDSTATASIGDIADILGTNASPDESTVTSTPIPQDADSLNEASLDHVAAPTSSKSSPGAHTEMVQLSTSKSRSGERSFAAASPSLKTEPTETGKVEGIGMSLECSSVSEANRLEITQNRTDVESPSSPEVLERQFDDIDGGNHKDGLGSARSYMAGFSSPGALEAGNQEEPSETPSTGSPEAGMAKIGKEPMRLTPNSHVKPTPTKIAPSPRRILNPKRLDSPARRTRSAKRMKLDELYNPTSEAALFQRAPSDLTMGKPVQGTNTSIINQRKLLSSGKFAEQSDEKENFRSYSPISKHSKPVGILSSKKRSRYNGSHAANRSFSQRSVAFGSPEAAEYHIGSPSVSLTPMPSSKVRALFAVPRAEELAENKSPNPSLSLGGSGGETVEIEADLNILVDKISVPNMGESPALSPIDNVEDSESISHKKQRTDIAISDASGFSPASTLDSSSYRDGITVELESGMERLLANAMAEPNQCARPSSGAEDAQFTDEANGEARLQQNSSLDPSQDRSMTGTNPNPVESKAEYERTSKDYSPSESIEMTDAHSIASMNSRSDSVPVELSIQAQRLDFSPASTRDDMSEICDEGQTMDLEKDMTSLLAAVRIPASVQTTDTEPPIEESISAGHPDQASNHNIQISSREDSPCQRSSPYSVDGTVPSRSSSARKSTSSVHFTLSPSTKIEFLPDNEEMEKSQNAEVSMSGSCDETDSVSGKEESNLESADISFQELACLVGLSNDHHSLDNSDTLVHLQSITSSLDFATFEKWGQWLQAVCVEIEKRTEADGAASANLSSGIENAPERFSSLGGAIQKEDSSVVKENLQELAERGKLATLSEWKVWLASVLESCQAPFLEISKKLGGEVVKMEAAADKSNEYRTLLSGISDKNARRARRKSLNRRRSKVSILEDQVRSLQCAIEDAKSTLAAADQKETDAETKKLALVDTISSAKDCRDFRPGVESSKKSYKTLNGLLSFDSTSVSKSSMSFQLKSGYNETWPLQLEYVIESEDSIVANVPLPGRDTVTRGKVTGKYGKSISNYLDACIQFRASKMQESNLRTTKCIPEQLQAHVWRVGRLHSTAHELQLVLRRYKAKLYGAVTSGFMLSVDFENDTAALRVTFEVGMEYPSLPLEVDLHVLRGSLDLDKLHVLLKKNAKPGFGNFLRTCDIISAYRIV